MQHDIEGTLSGMGEQKIKEKDTLLELYDHIKRGKLKVNFSD